MAVSVSETEGTYVRGPAPRVPLTPSSPAGPVILAYLGEQAGKLRSLDPLVRQDEPDSVHQMRVTTRRLRSTLRSFRRVLARRDTERLAAELKWLGRVLGEARDGEVLSGHLLASARTVPVEQLVGPVKARIRGHFAPARAAARAEVLTALDSPRYLALLDELDRVTAGPASGREAGSPAADVLPAQVRRARQRAARRMRRARHTPPGPARDTALHETRKAVKRARYAAEAVTCVSGKHARRFARRLKKVQSVLGEHQDAGVAGQVVRQLGMSAHLAGENAFSYGLLHERNTHDRERLGRRAGRAWRKASRGQRWMRHPQRS